jgi:polyisoprenoid-binding protein YceI
MRSLTLAPLLLAAGLAQAAPVEYAIEPNHTYPSFEADHMGLSIWRGKLTKTDGFVTYDKAAGTGTLQVRTDLASIDFGLPAMNAWAKGEKFFNLAERNPMAVYKGRFTAPTGGAPGRVEGELTFNGHTRPMTLTLNQLKCVPHPMLKRDLCGADAVGSFNRDEFGLDAGKDWGFKMDVLLRIQVEAIAKE